MANYPHVPKGQNKHNPNSHYEYSTLQDMAADRKVQADVRKEIRAKRSPQEQLELLDRRLGKGVGAVKERLKLLQAINDAYPKKGMAVVVGAKPEEKPVAKKAEPKVGAKKAGKKGKKAA